ncbi:MAG: polysaccharide deacetylase family protein [Sphingomonas sp.]
MTSSRGVREGESNAAVAGVGVQMGVGGVIALFRQLLHVALLLGALAVPTASVPDSHFLPPTAALVANPNLKRIALSFDDVPRGPGAFYDPIQRTGILIDALREAGVNQAAFFVNPRRIGPRTGGDARVMAYVTAGHVIADHSFSHHDASGMSPENFLADVDKAEAWLRGRAGYRPWFRFPGLDQGGHNMDKHRALLAGLQARGLLVAAVTVDGSDWNIERLAADARKRGAAFDDAALRDLYVETMVQAADFSDAVMRKAIGRSPAHMLLLHETDLAARYVPALVAALRKDGWEIVDADVAYADPVYHMPLGVPSNGTLTEAIGWEKGVAGPLSYDRTEPKVGNRLFAARVLRPQVAAGAAGSVN